MRKKILAAIAAGLITLGSFGVSTQAASRAEIAAIHVQTAADFKYWNDDSPTLQKITEFVEDVTNPNSENFIPPEDRIATFDMDGTFYCETAPIYFQEAMFLYRVLEDNSYQAPKKYLDLAKKIQPKVYAKEKLTPMVEIISYLTNNGFAVYIDSACGADTTRELVKDVIPIQYDRILASDFNFTSTKMGKDNPHDHFFDRHKEKIVISGKPLHDNAKTIKIFSIINQIGKKPVLAFGNSGGDSGMLEYTLQDNKYRSMSFFVICDDTERELGNPKRAASDTALALKRGWNPISMRDEFKTIYGDNVKKL